MSGKQPKPKHKDEAARIAERLWKKQYGKRGDLRFIVFYRNGFESTLRPLLRRAFRDGRKAARESTLGATADKLCAKYGVRP